MELLLVTGFLGAGKTTFLRRLMESWVQGRRLAIIVNEFGRVGVDGAMLSGEGISLREVTGGSVFCSCRLDQFEEALRQVINERPELILVEASGLSDPTSVRAVLSNFPEVRYLGGVALCDAPRLEKTLHTVRVCPKQLAVCDLILLNKTDLVSKEERDRLLALLAERYPLARIEATQQAAFDPSWLDGLQTRQEQSTPYEDSRDITLQKARVQLAEGVSKGDLEAFVRLVYEDTYRIKGMLRLKEGAFLLDCVGPSLTLTPCGEEQAGLDLVMLAGPGMPLRKSVQAARRWYPLVVEEVAYG